MRTKGPKTWTGFKRAMPRLAQRAPGGWYRLDTALGPISIVVDLEWLSIGPILCVFGNPLVACTFLGLDPNNPANERWRELEHLTDPAQAWALLQRVLLPKDQSC